MKIILALVLAANVFAQLGEQPPAIEKKPAPPDKVADTGAVTMPKVFFISPKDGANVKKKFKVKMGLEGMKVKAAGTLDVGTGHHHIIVDGSPIPKGSVVPKDEKNLHYGKAETTADLTLEPGEHTLTLQFADGNHLSYGPEMSATIKVKVK